MSTNQNAPSVEETLAKTDLGSTISEYKRPILISAAVILVLIVTYSVTRQVQQNKTQERLDQIFKVETEVFTPFLAKDSKLSAQDFKKSLLAISNEHQGHPQLIPSLLEALNKLEETNALDAETVSFAIKWMDRLDKKGNLHLLMALRISALLEDRGEQDQAIKILEGIMANKVEFLKTRVQFDLGRMYKNAGDKTRAKELLEKVASEESEYQGIAKLYLSEL